MKHPNALGIVAFSSTVGVSGRHRRRKYRHSASGTAAPTGRQRLLGQLRTQKPVRRTTLGESYGNRSRCLYVRKRSV